MAAGGFSWHNTLLLGYVNSFASVLGKRRKNVSSIGLPWLLGYRHLIPWQLLPLYLVKIRVWPLYRLALSLYLNHICAVASLHVGHCSETIFNTNEACFPFPAIFIELRGASCNARLLLWSPLHTAALARQLPISSLLLRGRCFLLCHALPGEVEQYRSFRFYRSRPLNPSYYRTSRHLTDL